MADHLSEGTDLSQVDALTVPWGGGGGGEGKGGEGKGGEEGGEQLDAGGVCISEDPVALSYTQHSTPSTVPSIKALTSTACQQQSAGECDGASLSMMSITISPPPPLPSPPLPLPPTESHNLIKCKDEVKRMLQHLFFIKISTVLWNLHTHT